MTEFAIALGAAAAIILLLGVVTWGLSLHYRDASLVDRIWSLLFMGGALAAAVVTGSPTPRTVLLLVLVSLWAVRLSLYLTWRNWGEGEDYRYREMRARRPDRFAAWSLCWVFGLQGALALVIGLPLTVAIAVPGEASIGLLDAAGVLLFVIGFYFEAVGDWQLARFKADPGNRGKVMDRGLWRYTRHPNYFGDTAVWWGLFLVAAATPWGLFTLLSPILMTALIIKVSGVAMLERTIGDRRPEYQAYAARTSAFIPWPPRRESSGA